MRTRSVSSGTGTSFLSTTAYATVLLHIETHEFEDTAEEDELIASYTPRFRR